ncbi:MAG: hypothetical protein GC154_05545 [bacterium]|nr:hypothetical protein [bacterium]
MNEPSRVLLQRWERRLALFILATTPFIITPDTEDSFLLGKYVWLMAFGTLWLLLIALQSAPRWFQPCEIDWPAGAVLAAYGFSMAVHYRTPNQLSALMTLLLFIGLFYAFRRYWSLGGSPRVVAWTLVLTAALLALYGVAQDAGYDLFSSSGGVRDWRARVIATLGNPNFLGGYIAYCIPVAAALGLRARAPFWERAAAGLALFCIVLGLALTFCVGATIGLLALLAVIPLALWRISPRVQLPLLWAALYLVLAASAVGWWVLPNPYNTHGRSLYQEAKSSPQWATGLGARRFNWVTTKIMMTEHPLSGIGFHNYLTVHIHYQGLNYQRYGAPHDRNYVIPVDQPHFQLMESAAEAGPLGAFAVSWLAMAWLCAAARRLRTAEHKWFAWGAYLGVWILFVHSFSSFPFHLPASSLLCVALASYLVTPAGREDGEPGFALRAAALIAAGLVIVYSFTWIAAERDLRRGRFSQGLAAIAYLEDARFWSPFNYTTHFLLGVQYDERGWTQNAIQSFERALRYQESHAVHYYLAGLYTRQGDLDRAIAEQRRVIELNPVFPGHYRELADLLDRAGKSDEAAAMRAEADELDARLRLKK